MGKGKKSGNAGLGKSLIKDATRAKRVSGGASWVRREVVRCAWHGASYVLQTWNIYGGGSEEEGCTLTNSEIT